MDELGRLIRRLVRIESLLGDEVGQKAMASAMNAAARSVLEHAENAAAQSPKRSAEVLPFPSKGARDDRDD